MERRMRKLTSVATALIVLALLFAAVPLLSQPLPTGEE